MSIIENKYHSTIKLEFRDLIGNILNRGRSTFHMYTIHRLLSLGLLVDFTFEYCENDTSDKFILIELDLKSFGKVHFKIDTQSNYGSVADDLSIKAMENFLNNYDTEVDNKGKKGRFGI